jgi:hypothetical protein
LKRVERPDSLAWRGPIAAKQSFCLLVVANEQPCYREELAPGVGEKAAAQLFELGLRDQTGSNLPSKDREGLGDA